MGYVVEKVTRDLLPPTPLIPPMLLTHNSFIHLRHYTTPAVEVVKDSISPQLFVPEIPLTRVIMSK